MGNPLFGMMGGGGVPNVMQLLQQLKANPAQVLSQKFRLPTNATDPTAILQHLLQSGQVSQPQIDDAYRKLQALGIKK